MWRVWRLRWLRVTLNAGPGRLGLGIGWRPETAGLALSREDLGFVEVVAESIRPQQPLPLGLQLLREAGMSVIPHGVSLGLGGGQSPDKGRLARMASLVERLESPLVSEHVAFVRAGGINAGHLMPVPRTRSSLNIVVANVRAAQSALPVPLAVEPAASLLEWPSDGTESLTEPEFLGELVERTGCLLLLDLANLHTNSRNHGYDSVDFLNQLPLHALGYVHVAGGVERDGMWHDTHAHAMWPEVPELIAELAARTDVPGMMLERDGAYPPTAELNAELDTISASWADGLSRGPTTRRAGSGPVWLLPQGRNGGSEPTAAERVRLEDAQHDLLAALVSHGSAPRGFDKRRVQATRAALRHKRLHEARAASPALVSALGADYQRLFKSWADQVTPRGSPGMDARAFAGWLPAARLTPAAAAELITGQLRLSNRPGLRVRRVGDKRRRYVTAVRLPGGRILTWGHRSDRTVSTPTR